MARNFPICKESLANSSKCCKTSVEDPVLLVDGEFELQRSPVVVNLKGECKLRDFYLLHPEFYYSRTNLTRKPVPRGILNRLL